MDETQSASSALSRRAMLGRLGALAALAPRSPAHAGPSAGAVRRFAVIGDTTAFGRGVQADQFGALIQQINRLEPPPEFLLCLGDHIWGAVEDEADLRKQWREWWAAAAPLGALPIHHITGNHTSYNAASRRIFKEATVSRLPRGAELSADGLQYVWRDGDTLLVLADTTSEISGQHGRIDWHWVDEALARHADARYKFVAGHFPALPVNGFKMPHLRIQTGDAESLWKTLVRHRVAAYLCAHIIAFDAQIHDGIPQICSAGGGCPVLYPPQSEYIHFAEIAMGPRRLEWRTVDARGTVRERAHWPFECPAATAWPVLEAQGEELPRKDAALKTAADSILLVRFESRGARRADAEQTLLTGWNDPDAPPAVWIGYSGYRLEVRISPRRGDPALRWLGPPLREGPLAFDLALHAGLGPGGVLVRGEESQPWSSLESESAYGFDALVWPKRWSAGLAHSGYARTLPPTLLELLNYRTGIVERIDPFLGSDLRVRTHVMAMPIGEL
jgi:hypothetical protein